MRRLVALLACVMSVLWMSGAGCGEGGGGGGACQFSSGLTAWCQNFRDVESCHTKWSPDTDCNALGYTQECGDNVYVTPGRMCP